MPFQARGKEIIMKTIHGVYTSAKIFTVNEEAHALDDYAAAQLQALCDNEAFADCKVRVMPDVHPGRVGTIGFTSTLGKRVLPNVIGIDIGCGVTLAQLKGKTKEFQKLDTVIRETVPSGFAVRKKPHHRAASFDLAALSCRRHINEEKALLSLGTLGDGNHFIELDTDAEGNVWLAVHTGSRHLGKEVTEHYLIEGQRFLKTQGVQVPYELTWLDGALMQDYLHDLSVTQNFAVLNREIIIDEIARNMKWKIMELCSCIHNYVDFSTDIPIIRKGAISAGDGEWIAIPINMRDGVILGHGRGNTDWNCSAPHGAGRILKREDVKNAYTVSAFKKEMRGIYSSCICRETLDEAPFAYRGLDAIAASIGETVTIDGILRPLYNYKAGGN